MKKRNYIITISCLICLLWVFGTVEAQTKDIPKPSLIVSYEKEILGDKGSLGVFLSIINDTDYNLDQIVIDIVSPEFLKWYKKGDEKNSIGQQIKEDIIGAHSVYKIPLVLGLKEGEIGEFNILFIVEYKWVIAGKTSSSFIFLEKPVKIDILGVDNLFGVPLSFASFIIPGLLFFIVLKLMFQFAFNKDIQSSDNVIKFTMNMQTEDKMVLGVILSVLIMGVGNFVNRLMAWDVLKNLASGKNLSILKIGVLALIGILTGLLTGAVYKGLKWLQKYLFEKKMLNKDDKSLDIVSKILMHNPEYNGKNISIRTNNNVVYTGSHYAEVSDHIYIVGWFYINKERCETYYNDLQKKYPDCFDTNGGLKQNQECLLKVLKFISEKGKGIIVEESSRVEIAPANKPGRLWEVIKKSDISQPVAYDEENQDGLLEFL